MADLRDYAKDAAYVAVGFGVIAFQKAQVRRQELRKQLDAQLGDAKSGFGTLQTSVEDQVKLLEERFAALGEQVERYGDELEARIEKALDELETRIPEQAREYFTTARSAAKEARGQVRQLVRTNGSAA